MRCGTYMEKPTRGCSPSLTISIPASSWRASTSATAAALSRRRRASRRSASPASWRSSRSDRCGGRGRLPQWVVRIRLVAAQHGCRSSARSLRRSIGRADIRLLDDVLVERELLLEEPVELLRGRADRLDQQVGVTLLGVAGPARWRRSRRTACRRSASASCRARTPRPTSETRSRAGFRRWSAGPAGTACAPWW